jgi:ribosomal-protein-alanine N-acetyltransferase
MSGGGADYVSTQVGSDYVFAIAVPNDAAQMRKINEACLPENYPYMFWFNMVSTNPGRSFICRSVKERRIVGYALICEDTAGQLRLLSLVVLPGHRGHGVAAGLLLRGRGRTCDLEVRVSNEGAIRLYERVGFRKIRIIPGYYADKEDAWLMTWSSDVAVDVSASPILPPVA